MRVCNNEYAEHVKRAHVPVPEPYLLVRGGRCKVEYPWIQTCQGLGCSLQLCTSFAWAHLQTIVSFLLLGTNGKIFHCTDSPANNSILSFYFVLFWEQMENPLKRRGTQTSKTKEARPVGFLSSSGCLLILHFAPIVAISLARETFFSHLGI